MTYQQYVQYVYSNCFSTCMVHVTINITRRSNQKKKTRKQSIESSAFVLSQQFIAFLEWYARIFCALISTSLLVPSLTFPEHLLTQCADRIVSYKEYKFSFPVSSRRRFTGSKSFAIFSAKR